MERLDTLPGYTQQSKPSNVSMLSMAHSASQSPWIQVKRVHWSRQSQCLDPKQELGHRVNNINSIPTYFEYHR